jgi:hypothetical protein
MLNRRKVRPFADRGPRPTAASYAAAMQAAIRETANLGDRGRGDELIVGMAGHQSA